MVTVANKGAMTSYILNEYIFRATGDLNEIFGLRNGKIYYHFPDHIEIFQYAPHHEFYGNREIIIHHDCYCCAEAVSSPDILVIPKDRFIEFINETPPIKDFFLGKLLE